MLNFLKDNRYDGATIGIARDDKLVYVQGYGETQSGAPMTPTTLLPTSSISKTITALAIMKLNEHGWLSLSDPVFGPHGILRELSSTPTEPNPGVYSITVEQLLHHTAGWGQHKPGLYDPMMNTVYLAQGINVVNISSELRLRSPVTPADIITYMLSQPLDNPPGVKLEYSNFGYCVLGRVIEAVSGLPYRKFVTDEILTPLGMWHTRIGPHLSTQDELTLQFPKITLPEGYIPLVDDLQNVKLQYDLLDSTLGWFSNVYDLMRFVTGVTTGMIINRSTLKLMMKQPPPPVSEHSETWHGLGVHVSNDQTWWQVGDPHDNEIVLFHRNQQLPKLGKLNTQASEAWSWVMIMSDNNRHNLRDVFNKMASSVSSWPDANLMVDDCADFVFTNSKSRVLAHPKIPESHFYTVTQALSQQEYHPTWIDGYTINGKTYFSLIAEQNLPDDDFIVEIDATSMDLDTVLDENIMRGYFLNYITSYKSHKHSGHVRHAAVFSGNERKSAQFAWQTPWRTYMDIREIYTNERRLIPVIQSVVLNGHNKEVTYMFEKHRHTVSRSFYNLTLLDLNFQIRQNSLSDFVLSYLDSYSQNGVPYFSAVFTSWKVGRWQTQTSLTRHELNQASALYHGLGYRPRILVGYEYERTPLYAVLWLRH